VICHCPDEGREKVGAALLHWLLTDDNYTLDARREPYIQAMLTLNFSRYLYLEGEIEINRGYLASN